MTESEVQGEHAPRHPVEHWSKGHGDTVSRGWQSLVKGSGYPIVSCRTELHVDELVQTLGVWLDAVGLF